MNDAILKVTDLKKHFSQGKGVMSFLQKQTIPAVDGVSFEVNSQETLGLVGESGCGKTTTGKLILKLSQPTSGSIVYDGIDIVPMTNRNFRPMRSKIQMIFQDLDAALNPKMRIGQILSETIKIHHKELDDSAVNTRMYELLEMVNLKKNKLSNFPSELSGGEKRRVGIARTLSVNPKFIVADEPTSALDVSIQAQVINLMVDLQKQLGLSYLFITHDLRLMELVSHRVAVMYLGRIVEIGGAKQVAKHPHHPYTEILWSSLHVKQSKTIVKAPKLANTAAWDVFDFSSEDQGCRFAPRCPIFAEKGQPDQCKQQAPTLKSCGEGHQVACHFPL
ncbi:MAG: ABC transporter ATP-binding protein [Gammaproteobacteria bacterium]|nr:ABC transporter ATP-binding protein [Gammaproteobacteria bacterium]